MTDDEMKDEIALKFRITRGEVDHMLILMDNAGVKARKAGEKLRDLISTMLLSNISLDYLNDEDFVRAALGMDVSEE